MAHTRISTTPRIVGRPLFGEKGSIDSAEAERLKSEIQEAFRTLSEGTNQAQVDLGILESVVEAVLGPIENPPDAGQMHTFLTMGA